MSTPIFSPANILFYAGGDPSGFAVVACDQYTSEPSYWKRVAERTSKIPSAFHMIFPEVYLKDTDFENRIQKINATMADYLDRNLFCEKKDAFVYVRRTLRDGRVRCGLIGQIDLEEYDYSIGSESPVRATEGTVLERIPPRVKIRENAPLELPHVMLLIDDPKRRIIEPLAQKRDTFPKLYSFPLMEDSGTLEGWLLPKKEKQQLCEALLTLEEEAARQPDGSAPLPYAVGDGNHSLATARKCYLDLKEAIGAEEAQKSPARYALVELVNLHDESLVFEAIHRHVSGVNAADVMEKLAEFYSLSEDPAAGGQKVIAVLPNETKTVYIQNPSKNLAVGSLQAFLDDYTSRFGGETDYIHGANVVETLVKEQGGIGFLLDPMEKAELFPTVRLDGALPRKTFSMGEACDKRFYFEARKIK